MKQSVFIVSDLLGSSRILPGNKFSLSMTAQAKTENPDTLKEQETPCLIFSISEALELNIPEEPIPKTLNQAEQVKICLLFQI